MTPEQELRIAAKALDQIEHEPRYHLVIRPYTGASSRLNTHRRYERLPSRAWQRYMKAYWNWINASRRLDPASPHTGDTASGGALERGRV